MTKQKPILPPTHLIAAVSWSVKEKVKAAQVNESGPSSFPEGHLLVGGTAMGPLLQTDLASWSE